MRLLAWIKSALLIALIAGCGAAATQSAPSAVEHEAQTDGVSVVQAGATKIHCGYVRWNVKTGTDSKASLVDITHPQMATINELGGLPNPLPSVSGHIGPNRGRYPDEQLVYTVQATLVEFAGQHDSDIHLVLESNGQRMVVEIPNPQCVKGGPFKAGITNARRAFLRKYPHPPVYPKPFAQTSQPVTVTGVAFFDYPHGQTGELPNTLELHPVLSITFN